MIANKQKIKPPPANGFVKGRSGNPTGRPKLTKEALDVIEACKAKTPEALDTLVNIMQSGELEKNRLTAALAIIERGYGKPVQQIDADINAKVVHIVRDKLSREEWLASLEK